MTGMRRVRTERKNDQRGQKHKTHICKNQLLILCLHPLSRKEGGIIKWAAVSVSLFVRLSVCPVPQHSSGMERPWKPKFGRMEGHNMSNP